MKIISLKCNNCSADLEIPEHTNFFNCSFCQSSLGIKRTGSAVFTEVLSEIKEDTDQLLDLSENILVEKQIARLDRDWEQNKASFITYKDGTPSLPEDPSSNPMIIILPILVGLGILIALFSFNSSYKRMSHSSPSSRLMPMEKLQQESLEKFKKENPNLNFDQLDKRFPSPKVSHGPSRPNGPPMGFLFFFFFIAILGTVFSITKSSSSAKEYQLAKTEYEIRRQALLKKLKKE